MIYSVLFDVHECFACMYVSALLEHLVPPEVREATGSLELEVQTVETPLCGAGNGSQVHLGAVCALIH